MWVHIIPFIVLTTCSVLYVCTDRPKQSCLYLIMSNFVKYFCETKGGKYKLVLVPKKISSTFLCRHELNSRPFFSHYQCFLSLVKLHSGTFPGKKFEHTVDEHYLYYQGFPKALNKSRNVLTRSLNLVKFLSKAKNFIVTAAKIKSEMV